jgi:4-hydroxy-tetrahydrodipicolinate synthase
MPYYNRPSQEGLLRHIESVAKAISLPIVLYNIPIRTGVELSVESTLRVLDSAENVVGIKDATGGVAYCQELVRRAGDRVLVMSGDDPLTLPLMSVGATGVVSVTSNVFPRQVAALTDAASRGDYVQARKRHLDLLPVHRALFVEPNPQPTKAALELLGRMRGSVRLPLLPASQSCREALRQVFTDYEAT